MTGLRELLRASRPLLGEPLRKRRGAGLVFAALCAITAVLTALEPLTLAPVITAALGRTEVSGPSNGLSLNNIGAAILAALRIDAGASRSTIVLVGVLLYVLVVACSSALDFATARWLRGLRLSIAGEIQSRLHAHLMALPLPFLVRTRVAELTSRLVNDVALATQTLEVAVRWIGESLALLIIYSLLLARTDGFLTLGIGVTALLHVALTRALESGMRASTGESSEALADITATAAESLSQVRMARSFASESQFHRRFGSAVAAFQQRGLRHFLRVDSEIPLRRVVNALSVAIAVGLSFLALTSGRLTLPGFVLFVFVSRQMIQPLSLLGRAFLQTQAFLGASLRLNELLAIRPAVQDGTRQAPPLADAIEFREVSFAYSPGTVVLQDVSFRLPRGKVVAIVGPSGAGKSTLADLVLRLHDPSSGVITYDGVALSEFVQASYRSRFGVVAEEPHLIHGSIEENITYGRAAASEAIQRAARTAGADEFVGRLPDGYATVVGERGARLSRGERQRIAIARAVYGLPELLVLDEATSALDSESERAVQRALDRALSGTTALVIAHRLSTVANADEILVLQNGRIVASGRHAELMERSELYKRLYLAQQPTDARSTTQSPAAATA